MYGTVIELVTLLAREAEGPHGITQSCEASECERRREGAREGGGMTCSLLH